MLTVRFSEGELRDCRLAAVDRDITMGEWARAHLLEVAAKAKAARARRAK
jgi:hypothetical protein